MLPTPKQNYEPSPTFCLIFSSVHYLPRAARILSASSLSGACSASTIRRAGSYFILKTDPSFPHTFLMNARQCDRKFNATSALHSSPHSSYARAGMSLVFKVSTFSSMPSSFRKPCCQDQQNRLPIQRAPIACVLQICEPKYLNHRHTSQEGLHPKLQELLPGHVPPLSPMFRFSGGRREREELI